jgi:hypothetical protein
MTLVEKMARAMFPWAWEDGSVRDRQETLRKALLALEAIKPSEDMFDIIAGEMDVAMQMEFNCVFAPDVMKRMARAACFALVKAAILEAKQ